MEFIPRSTMSHDILEQTDQLKKGANCRVKIFIKLNQKELDSRQLRVHTALPSFFPILFIMYFVCCGEESRK